MATRSSPATSTNRSPSDAASPTRPPTSWTRLLQTEVDGNRLTDVEARTLVAFLLTAGNETTRHLLGNLIHTLATQPELMDAIRQRPEHVAVAVEESLRLDSPVAVLMRVALVDTNVRGVAIAEGSRVAFGLASANRDEAHYDDPHRFRLDRSQPKAHVAFGGGPHVCPGAALARLEGRIFVERLVARVARLELADDHRWQKVPVFWANGPQQLPCTLTAH